MDYPQDWLSAADRGSVCVEACLRFRAYRAYLAAMPNDVAVWCDRYAATLGRDGVTGDTVSRWIDAGGWWKGTRRGVHIELSFVDRLDDLGGLRVEWRATANKGKKKLSGYSPSVMAALQDIGVDLSHRLHLQYKAAAAEKKEKAEEIEEAA